MREGKVKVSETDSSARVLTDTEGRARIFIDIDPAISPPNCFLLRHIVHFHAAEVLPPDKPVKAESDKSAQREAQQAVAMTTANQAGH